jgi:glutamate transport system permease protein
MSTVLYDHPGPRTVSRHRLYSVISVLVILALLGLLLWRMWDRGQLEYELWEPFLTPEYVTALIVDGLWRTVQMALFSVVFAVVFGLVFGLGKMSDHAWLSWPSWVVVEFFRAVPVLLLMFFIHFSYGVGDGFGSFWSVVFALTLYNGSVLAEVFRAGVNAVPKGQAEAAYAIGMRKTQVMTLVLLPQAVKIMLPAIISQMVVALKDTSLGAAIGAPGLTFVGEQIYTEFRNQLQTVIVLACLYILANLVLTWIATMIQKRLVGEKKAIDVEDLAGAQSLGPGNRHGEQG